MLIVHFSVVVHVHHASGGQYSMMLTWFYRCLLWTYSPDHRLCLHHARVVFRLPFLIRQPLLFQIHCNENWSIVLQPSWIFVTFYGVLFVRHYLYNWLRIWEDLYFSLSSSFCSHFLGLNLCPEAAWEILSSHWQFSFLHYLFIYLLFFSVQ